MAELGIRCLLKLVSLFILDSPISFLSCSPCMSGKDTPCGSNVTRGGNRSTRRKPAILGRGKLDNSLLTRVRGNFNQKTAWSRNEP